MVCTSRILTRFRSAAARRWYAFRKGTPAAAPRNCRLDEPRARVACIALNSVLRAAIWKRPAAIVYRGSADDQHGAFVRLERNVQRSLFAVDLAAPQIGDIPCTRKLHRDLRRFVTPVEDAQQRAILQLHGTDHEVLVIEFR